MNRHLLAGLVAVVACTGASRTDAYQEEMVPKPVVVVSFNHFAGLVENINFLGTPTKDDRYIDKITKLSKLITEGEGIDLSKAAGIDSQKPLGSALYRHGDSMRQLGFVPVTDADAVFAWLKPLVGDVAKNDSGVYEVKSKRLSAWVKVENGWMYWALSPDHLDPLPDPLAALDDLPAKHDFAVRLHMANVPEEFRSAVMNQFRTQSESADAGAASAALAAFQKETNAFRERLLSRFASEAEHVTFGMSVAKDTSQIKAQMVVKPVSGSGLASHFAALNTDTTRFGGLFKADDKSTLSLGMTGKLDPQVVTDTKTEVEAYRKAIVDLIDASPEVASDGDKQLLKDLGGAIIDAVQGTLDAGRLDAAVKITAGSPGALVAAVEIVGGDAILKQLDRLAEATKDNPESGFQIEEATHESVRISSFVVPQGPETETAVKFFGPSKLYVAVNEKTLYLAYGVKALDLIKEAIASPGEEGVQPFRLTGKAVMLSRITQPTGGPQQLQLLMGFVGQQLARGDGFEVAGKGSDGVLVVDVTMNKGFISLGAFAIPIVGQLMLPNVDLNNPWAMFGF